MADFVILHDPETRDDLRTFLERLHKAGQPEARVTSRGRVLAVYGCTQAPRGITDVVPVVLVMRAFPLQAAPEPGVDTTVTVRSLLDRLARLDGAELELDLPDVTMMAAWAGVLPPVSGWERTGSLDPASLAQVARAGIERVAAALPDDPGEAVVHRVRASVWGLEIAPGIPAAAAFAAESMGFLGAPGGEPAQIARSLTWTRVTCAHGHVVVRSILG